MAKARGAIGRAKQEATRRRILERGAAKLARRDARREAADARRLEQQRD